MIANVEAAMKVYFIVVAFFFSAVVCYAWILNGGGLCHQSNDDGDALGYVLTFASILILIWIWFVFF